MISTSFKIRTKLMALAICSVTVLTVLAAAGVAHLSHMDGSISEIREGQETIRTLSSIQKAIVDMDSGVRAYLKQPDESQLDIFRKSLKTAQDGMQLLKSIVSGNPADERQLRDAEAALLNWQTKVAEPAVTSRKKLEGSKTPGDAKATSPVYNPESIADVSTILLNLTQNRLALANKHVLEAEKQLKEMRGPIYVGVALFSVVLLISTYLMAGRISKPMTRAAELAQAISVGDLSRRIDVKGSDESSKLGASLNEMAEDLTNYSKHIMEGVDVLTTSVAQIASAASELFSSASQTASAVSETTAIINEMEKTAKIVNETSRNVENHSRHSDEIADSGAKATGETIQKMSLIKDKMEIVRTAVVGLSDNTKFVEEVVAAVQDLADQSNLLAVNASIEAARSGQHGKGFAVVAHEIKSLADQSREATDRVNKILQEIRKSVSSVVMATEEGNKAVLSGVEQSEAAGQSIQKLADSIGEFSRAAGLITSSTNKQFARVERVATAMRNVELAMNSSAEGSTQLQNEARRLEELARSLQDIVRHYKLELAS
ncbi:MAG: methyl-accepting chemotaxis protein [Desulfomonile tiedjei]|uniref:Methyl-accepting chemotaxis protein n=1 Tax=Desulfomonile tiedjei TaxID=2358 RepID=A0A9D6UZ41_9BACT|nr:methyl-accepting chemotaxis protein [Desulfomonile tiedjei]